MKKTNKIVLAVVIAGIFLSGVGIASAATKLRTVTTPRGTEDVYEITGTVTEVSTPTASQTEKGIRGWFHRMMGEAKVKDSADGTIYTIRTGELAASGETLTVGETVTIQGTKETRGNANEVDVWTFTGADGKTVTLRNTDGTPIMPKRESVSVTGTVTAITNPSATSPVRDAETLTIKKADGTSATVMINAAEAKEITVAVGDSVTVEGFAMTKPATGSTTSQTVIMAQKFTGADGKTVTLQGACTPGPAAEKRTSVTVIGKVTAVAQPSTTTTPEQGEHPAMGADAETLTVQETDGTVVLVKISSRDAKSITVAVGDTVTVVGFRMTMPATGSTSGQTVIMAQTFTGADGKTVTLQDMGGRGDGRGFRGGMMGHGWGAGSDGASTAPGSINS